jgi:hypothetical protein
MKIYPKHRMTMDLTSSNACIWAWTNPGPRLPLHIDFSSYYITTSTWTNKDVGKNFSFQLICFISLLLPSFLPYCFPVNPTIIHWGRYTGKALDLHSTGAHFELHTSCLNCKWVWFSSAPPGKCRDNISVRQWLSPSKSFPIHHSLITLTYNVTVSILRA